MPEEAHGSQLTKNATCQQMDSVLFFARCPPTFPEADLLQVFSRHGEVKDLNLYRRWAKAKNSKGCGTVTYADRSAAESAMLALNGKYGWPDSDAKMVLEWFDQAKMHGNTRGADSTNGMAALRTADAQMKASKPPSPTAFASQQSCCQLLKNNYAISDLSASCCIPGGNQANINVVPTHLGAIVTDMVASSFPAVSPISSSDAQQHRGASGVIISGLPVRLQNNWAAAPNSILQGLPASSALQPGAQPTDMAAALGILPNSCGTSCSSTQSLTTSVSLQDLSMYAGRPAAAPVGTWSMLGGDTAVPVTSNAWTQEQLNSRQTVAAVMPTPLVSSAASNSSSMSETTSPMTTTSFSCTELCGSPGLLGVMDNFALLNIAQNPSTACTSGPTDLRTNANSSLLDAMDGMSWLQLQQQQVQAQQQHEAVAAAQLLAASPGYNTGSVNNGSGLLPGQAGWGANCMAGGAGIAGWPSAAPQLAASAAPQPPLQEARLALDLHTLSRVAGWLGGIAQATGAEVSIDAVAGGLQLRLRGDAAQIEAAAAWLRSCM